MEIAARRTRRSTLTATCIPTFAILLASLPERDGVECAYVVHGVMALAGHALVRIQPAHHIRRPVVLGLRFVGPHSGMAVAGIRGC